MRVYILTCHLVNSTPKTMGVYGDHESAVNAFANRVKAGMLPPRDNKEKAINEIEKHSIYTSSTGVFYTISDYPVQTVTRA